MDLKKKGFQLPENISFDSESHTNTYGKLTAEAFERGFGTTVGNSLRRVLLSSIEGAAVTAVRINGVLHEFSTLPGVKEDMVDIVLNIKQLRVKLHSDGPKIVSINIKGPGEVTGKDITGDQIEILNPDQHIATVDKGVKFSMELTVEKGKGYIPAKKSVDEDQPVDIIPIDAIFTPIKKVNFWVEAARVGQSTDYDKLVMEIWTDGSITPEDAMSQASVILKEHIDIFSFNSEPKEVVEEEEPVASVEFNSGDIMMDDFDYEPVLNENLLKNVDEMELSVRSYNCLKNADIRTIADLVQKTEQEMLRTKNFGRKSLNEIKEIVLAMGLHFNMRVDVEDLEKLAKMKRIESAT
ncbi:MAG TPA: DNA-directed RNA polymerase subunit alpha [Nitrospirae bacterium]|nr:DNA-directed RNA polymerase subunit alpha [bacterium BMS3Abin09]GBE41511.1 DNA-directed RNA polymerase subunit alpha [bacterium BMS3Bbin09]HDZ83965.1 DNA-directed RNA polymerase subunit alpha [Nitrospirota bacterium]